MSNGVRRIKRQRFGVDGSTMPPPPRDYRAQHQKARNVLTELLAQDKRAEAVHEEFLSTEERWALHHAVGTLEAVLKGRLEARDDHS